MKKKLYIVTVAHHYWEEFRIEAKSEEEARELALSDAEPSYRDGSYDSDGATDVELASSKKKRVGNKGSEGYI